MAVPYEISAPPRRRWPFWILGLVILLLLAGKTVAGYVIEYQWWREMGQVQTWIDTMIYSLSPVIAAALIAFIVLWLAHARGIKFGGSALRWHRGYAKLVTLGLLLFSILLASASVDTWTVVRYFGGVNPPPEATAFKDPVFGKPLSFYLFELPFYTLLRQYLLVLAIAAGFVYWATARGWQLRGRFAEMQEAGEFDVRILGLENGFKSKFLRGVLAIFLLALAFQFYLGRYGLLFNDHRFMVGVDYVNENFTLPLQWLLIASTLASVVFVIFGRFKLALVIVLALILKAVIPGIAGAAYVRPNEISLQRPYIQRHIEATRSAFGLADRMKEIEVAAASDSRIDLDKHRALLENVRLWDWRAFHDTVAQIQALRPYYTFNDTDVDRYTIDGRLRQVLLTPRELDIRQLPEARAGWINPHFIYTHGYGVVMAEANRITPDGLPMLFIQDAPARVESKSLKLTRPEIYYGEVTHEPVFVHTAQAEFNYPSGSDNKFAKYEGKGGFPVSSLPMRVAAALAEGDYNILLTSYLTPESRMVIRRNVKERLQTLAGFLSWDGDPYLVLTDSGRLVWTVDGYTTSNVHPYSRAFDLANIGRVNYMRNSVKATVDAYDGETRLYIFDSGDPIIRAYQRLFPQLLRPASEMPPDLRTHARYPETLFRVQAEVYRRYHMRDPQAFYNQEDVWDIAKHLQGGQAQALAPTYVVATLPGEDTAEFLLMLPFTPRNKDNMIGVMVARCDGENLGERVVLQLSKQTLISGPMQIEARINQDQNISKDLTLWSQQGSSVLRGQILTLPVEDTFLYVEPLYLQASEARMPQLKKIVMALGNRLIYTDTYDQALAELASILGETPEGLQTAAPPAAAPTGGVPGAAVAPLPQAPTDRRLDTIKNRLRRYRELASQGKWAEAGRELEAVEAEVNRR